LIFSNANKAWQTGKFFLVHLTESDIFDWRKGKIITKLGLEITATIPAVGTQLFLGQTDGVHKMFKLLIFQGGQS
jgi:hypothetical protein